MTSRTFGVFAVLSLAVAAGAADPPKTTEPPARSVVLTGAAAKALFKQCSRESPAKVQGYWNPSTKDIQDLEARWPRTVDGRRTPTLSDSYRQYAGFLRDGRRHIYLNALPPSAIEDSRRYGTGADWRQRAEVVCDGGSRFWGVEYDVPAQRFQRLAFNGR